MAKNVLTLYWFLCVLISRASPTLLMLAYPSAQQLTLCLSSWRCIMTIHHTQKVCSLTPFKMCRTGKCATHKCSSLHCMANRADKKLRVVFPWPVVPCSLPSKFFFEYFFLKMSTWTVGSFWSRSIESGF